MTFKIAYCAGHYLNTPGKRLPKELDAAQTREWVLNDRVADYFARAALEYEDVEILRTDDSAGKVFIDIPERTKKANAWGANLYLDIHHNAAGKVFSGGGVVAFSYPGSAMGRKYRDAIYEAVINAGGLKGNRDQPKQEKGYDSLYYAKAPAVLMEYGFMDSKVDAPVILTDEYSKLVAYATMEGIAKVAGLKKKAAEKESYSLEMRILKHGCKGEDVRALQILLIGNGYSCGNAGADGDFGDATLSAVCKYQRDNGIGVDGVAGPKTMKKLMGLDKEK